MLSTSIKELTPIILYLKYIVEPNDILIIEEPEAHIHPANQRILVKYMVEAINEGLNVLLTTHSDYIIEQINNFIRLSSASEDVFNKYNYSKKNTLKPNELNIYHFTEEMDGLYSYITEKLDISELGFTEENFSKVSKELYGESMDINEL